MKPDRHRFIGGSDARIIMSGDENALLRLWKEKRGEAEPEDFGDNLVVQLGVATEALNRAWYERGTGRAISDVQRWVQHPVRRFLAATLDGFVNDLDAVFEAKFMLPWSFSEEAAAEKHMAQLQHNNRAVADSLEEAGDRLFTFTGFPPTSGGPSDSWATKAAELGWTDFDLFGADSIHPQIAWLNSGLLWSLPNHTIADLRADRATLQTPNGSPQTFYRTPHPRARTLLWEISH